MKTLFLVLLVVTKMALAGEHQKVIGGIVEPNYPAAVDFGSCSGVLVQTAALPIGQSNIVVTAGHCYASSRTIIVKNADGIEQSFKVRYAVPYPTYDPSRTINLDLLVLILDDIVSVPGIEPAIITEPQVKPGYRVVGYGITGNPNDDPTLRRSYPAEIRFINQNYPFNMYVISEMGPERGGPCQGDSGGPLFIADTNQVVGVLSAGDCTIGGAAVIYNLSAAADFIEAVSYRYNVEKRLPPEFDFETYQWAVVNEPFTIKVTPIYDNPTELTFVNYSLPADARFDASTSEIIWTPRQLGIFNILFGMTDGILSDIGILIVKVSDRPNSPPVIELPGTFNLATGANFQCQLSAYDPDGTDVYLNLIEAHSDQPWVDPFSGLLTWRPAAIGDYQFTIEVHDDFYTIFAPITFIVTNAADVKFKRGWINGDNSLDISEAIALLSYLFAKAPPPSCLDAADTNDSGTVNIADAVKLLQYLFNRGEPLPEPFQQLGVDTTADNLSCDWFKVP